MNNEPPENPVSRPFRMGEFLVLPDRNRLSRENREVTIEPRLMQVLIHLAGRPGEVVMREKLKIAVWEDPLMGDDSLNRAISDLRRILGDDTTTPVYIETIRKVGYRLVAPVTSLAPEKADTAAGSETGVPGRIKTGTFLRTRRIGRSVVALAVLGCIIAILYVSTRDPIGMSPEQLYPATPLTSEPGLEVRPDLSPDGTQVAFAKKYRGDESGDIYIGRSNAESPRRITSHPDYENYPTWSPDGSSLAFARVTNNSSGIFTIPAAGGEPHCIYRTEGFLRHLDWSPTGQWLVFSLSPDNDDYSHLMLLDIQEEIPAAHPLTAPARGETSDTYPRFSPAGNEVAFIRTGRSGLSDIFCVDPGDGQPRRLTKGQINVWGLDWNAGSDEVCFSSFAGGPYTLSAVSVAERVVRRIPVLTEWVRYPTLARDADRLVFESRRETQDIIRLFLDPSDPDSSDSEPVVVSNTLDCEPSWSPDATKIAFVSTRSGFRELWVCDSDGSSLRQLTSLVGAHVAAPVWSPDGTRLAFRAAGEDIAMYVIDYLGGTPRRISPDGHNALPCSWSRDGKCIYYASDVNGEWQIWSIDPDTDAGNAVQVTLDGGIAANESPDGQTLYLVLPDRTGIWSRPTAGGTLQCVVSDQLASHFQSWAVTKKGIYFVRPGGSLTEILLHDKSTNKTREIAKIPSYPTSRFSIASDGKSLLFVRSDHLDIDLMKIDGSRGGAAIRRLFGRTD